MLHQLVGNGQLTQSLHAALNAGRLSHSVLLLGEAGTGTGFAARCLAADFLYPNGGAAAQAVMESRAPECIEVRGEGASGEIKIDRVRAVRRSVYDTALSAAGRVVIVYGAQKMNIPSANALLKVLEEPPQGVLFILTATSAAALLPTIRSRCNAFSLAPATLAQCEAYLHEKHPTCQNAQLLAAVYGGRIGLCVAAATQPEAQKSLDTALRLVQAVAQKDEYTCAVILAAYEKDKPGAKALLGNAASVAAAVLEGTAGLEVAPLVAAKVAARCGNAFQRLEKNVSPKLVLTALAIELCR